MEPTEQLRAWTYRRLCLDEGARSLESALKAVVAVYATHPTAPLSLWARSPSFTPARYRRIDRSRKAIRLPAMRRTVFLVPSKDAAHVFSAVKASPSHALRPLKRHGFSEKDYARVAKRILAAAKEPLTSGQLEDAAGIKGAELGTVLRCLRYEGRLVTVAGESLNMAPHGYVDAASWIPEGFEADEERARAWLAGAYLRAYGPARIEDFVWWSGLPKGAAREALNAHQVIDVGNGHLLNARDEAAFDRTEPLGNTVAVLPRWDAYTMGYAPDGRRRLVHPDIQSEVYTPIGTGLSGDGNPVILVDGEVAAIWTFSQKAGADIRPFDGFRSKTKKLVDEKIDEIAGLLTTG